MLSRCVRGPGKQVTIALGWDCTQMEKGLNLFLHHCWCNNVFLFPLHTIKKDFEMNQPSHHVILLDGRSSLHSWNACEVKRNWDHHPAIMALCAALCVALCVSDILYAFQFHATWQDHKFIRMCACHIPRRISFLKFLITAITSSPREMSSALKDIYRGPWLCALLPVRWEDFWVTSTVISGDCKAVGAALKSHCTCQSSALTDSVRMDVKQNRATDLRGEYQSLSQDGKWRSFVQVQSEMFCSIWWWHSDWQCG